MSSAKSMFDLATAHLVETKEGLELSEAGLQKLSQALAKLEREPRIDALVGVVAALRAAEEHERGERAAASLLGIVLTVIEKTQLTEQERKAWTERAAKLTGQAQARKLFDPQSRPEGTIPAGPMARFTALSKDKKY